MVATLDHIFREEWGRILATLIGFLGDFGLAEEAAQEAFAIAAHRWPHDGDLGALVLLPGGEAGTLQAWWNAADGSEWRWQVELYNHR